MFFEFGIKDFVDILLVAMILYYIYSYILIAMLVYAAVPDKMLMVYAMIVVEILFSACLYREVRKMAD